VSLVGAGRQDIVGFASAGRQETVQQQSVKAIMQQGDSKGNNNNSSVGGSAASGTLTVGGLNFSISEQAARFLQQAFEAMKEPAVQANQEGEGVKEDKGKVL
jgi:hypothetical protein